jgi:Domain of unknown function (DUF4153)
LTNGGKRFGFLPDMSGVFQRVPVAAGVAVLFTVVLCAMIIIGGDDTGIFTDTAITGTAAFLGAGIGHLFAESFGMNGARNVIAALAGALVAALVMYFYVTLQTSELFLLAGLWLLLMVSPYLHRGASAAALWMFNFKLFLALLLATIVLSVFGGGLTAIVAALNILFDVDLGSKPYQLIWTTATMAIGPLYGLALIPQSLTEEFQLNDHIGTVLERAQSVLVNYVLVPLVLVYAVILHAYAVKIVLGGTLPKGQIATIVSMFTITGTATWLLSWPWRERGTWLLQQFSRGWFWLLPVPVVLLVVGLVRRIGDYGVSPDRYAVALVAVWAIIVFAYLLLRRRSADMRVLIGSAAVLLLVTSFGPWGAYGVTARDQNARLTALLEQAGALKDGKFVKKLSETGSAASGDAYSIVSLLGQVRGLDALKAIAVVEDTKENRVQRWYSYRLVGEINDRLGITYGANKTQLSINNYDQITHTVPMGSKLIGPINLRTLPQASETLPEAASMTLENDMLVVASGGLTVRLPIAEVVKKLQPFNNPNFTPQAVFALELDQHFTLLVQNADGELGAKPVLRSLSGWLVVKP